MGYYPNMMSRNLKSRRYLVAFNDIGEAVIYTLGPDDKPTGFVVSRTSEEAVAYMAQSVHPDAQILWNKRDYMLVYRLFDVTTWAAVARLLNGKACAAKSKCKAGWEIAHHEWRGKYAAGAWRGGKFSVEVTDEGKKYDEEFYPAAAATEEKP